MIQLDPKTKLPIWPDGKVPPHPRDKHGNPLAPPPINVPPPMPTVPLSGPGAIPPDRLAQLEDRLEAIQQKLNEVKARVDRLSPD